MKTKILKSLFFACLISFNIFKCYSSPNKVDLGYGYVIIICEDGQVMVKGKNKHVNIINECEIKDDKNNLYTHIIGPNKIVDITAGQKHALALGIDGMIWAWGNNSHGQLGIGKDVKKSNPVLIPTLTDIIDIDCGEYHTVALRKDGTVWTWGDNTYGQLGDGTHETKSEPVMVKGISNITSISAGRYHTLALSDDGTLWVWGKNKKGQLGNGSNVNECVPVMVSGFNGKIKEVAAGENHSMALLEDGTLYTWGGNDAGQLSVNNYRNSNVPVLVPDLTNILSIAAGANHSLALKVDGTTWEWGLNPELLYYASSNMLPYKKPTQITNLSNIVTIGAGYHQSIAIDANGKQWAW